MILSWWFNQKVSVYITLQTSYYFKATHHPKKSSKNSWQSIPTTPDPCDVWGGVTHRSARQIYTLALINRDG